jgi:hypothetical protein
LIAFPPIAAGLAGLQTAILFTQALAPVTLWEADKPLSLRSSRRPLYPTLPSTSKPSAGEEQVNLFRACRATKELACKLSVASVEIPL